MPLHVDYVLEIEQLPDECILDIAQPGPADAVVAHWREQLGFTVNRERAIGCLLGYGAWGAADLAADTDETIAECVLWLAALNFREYQMGGEDAGSDIFALE